MGLSDRIRDTPDIALRNQWLVSDDPHFCRLAFVELTELRGYDARDLEQGKFELEQEILRRDRDDVGPFFESWLDDRIEAR